MPDKTGLPTSLYARKIADTPMLTRRGAAELVHVPPRPAGQALASSDEALEEDRTFVTSCTAGYFYTGWLHEAPNPRPAAGESAKTCKKQSKKRRAQC
jgi:hypothetical protein